MHYHDAEMAKNGTEKRWNVSTTPALGYVSWRPGYGLPLRWTSRLEREDLPYVVELDFATNPGTGPECRAVRFLSREGGEPISARRVGDIRIGECMQIAITGAAAREEHGPGGMVTYTPGAADLTEQATLARPRTRPTDRRISDEHLQAVASIYRAHLESGRPTQAVADELFATYSTAARWVMEARKRDFLPPAKRTHGRKSPEEKR
jgi:hypothetical protein